MTASKGSAFRGRPIHGAEVVKPRDPKKVIRRLWQYLKPHKAPLALVIASSFLTTLVSLAGPYLIGVAIDKAISKADMGELIRITLLMLSLYLFNTLATWVQNHFMVGLSNQAVQVLRNDLFRKVLRLPIPTFDKTPTGELMSRMINDVQNISGILSQGALQLISGILSITAVISVMFVLNWRLALVTTFTVPVVFFIIGNCNDNDVVVGQRGGKRFPWSDIKPYELDIGSLQEELERSVAADVRLCRQRENAQSGRVRRAW